MLQQMARNAGVSRVGLIVFCGVLIILGALAMPGLLSSQREANRREVAVMLRTLASVQADFRANDRDGNGVNDFWTADVKGLHTMTSALVPGAADPSLKLIDLRVAAADGDDTFHPAGGENVPLSKFSPSEPFRGYWFMALDTDQSIEKPAERPYKTDTKGTPPMGAVHHGSRFGFVAFPDTPKAGDVIYRVNEHNAVFQEWIKDRQKTGPAGPGSANIPPWFLEWPNDEQLKKHFHPKNCCTDRDNRR